jgi:hypothetical protein
VSARFRHLAALAVLWGASAPARAADRPVLLCFLPDSPAASALRLAEGVEALAGALEERLGLDLRIAIFRREADALAFARSGAPLALVLAEARFAAALAAERPLAGVARLRYRGGERFRKLLVRRPTAAGEPALTIAISAAEPEAVRERVRALLPRGSPEPSWIVSPDDFHAVAAVIFGEVSAAWVADYNPMLEAHLGRDLVPLAAGEERETPWLALVAPYATPDAAARLADLLAAAAPDRAVEAALEGLSASGFAPFELAAASVVRLGALPGDLEVAGIDPEWIPPNPPLARDALPPPPFRLPAPALDWDGLGPPE